METLRAVTYNRCSTEEESQKDALVKQVKESKESIAEQGWLLVDTYVEAKSGTTVKGRNEYNRLYRDLETDRFDVIVIKSQDRLMRNTRDWYLFLDRMQRNRKRLYMYLEQKFYSPDDALITGIKAILAEEYSRELSKKINHAHKNRQREGKHFVLTNQTYGYRKLADQKIIIEEREAGMIRLIYELSANGYGTHRSAEILWQNGYCNRKGRMISPSLIRNIIRNPIYMGTVVQNRRHYDFESKQIIQNPRSEWIIHENAVPAIIEEDLYTRANRGLDCRKQERSREQTGTKEKSFGKHALTGKLVCGLCGSPYYRTVRRKKEGNVTEWKCCNYLRNGRKKRPMSENPDKENGRKVETGCDNVHINERKLYEEIERLCRETDQNPELEEACLMKNALSLIRTALAETDLHIRKEETASSFAKLSGQKERLLEKLLDGIISDADYQKKERELQNKIESLRDTMALSGSDCAQSTWSESRLEARMETIRQKLEGGLIRQAKTTGRIRSIRKIAVFPDRLEIRSEDGGAVCLPQTCATSRQPVIADQKEQVLKWMGRRPQITARELAGKMGVNLSLIQRRIRELKAEGRLGYNMSNGRGEWILAEESIKKDLLDFSD